MQSREGNCRGDQREVSCYSRFRYLLMLTASFRRSEFKTPGLHKIGASAWDLVTRTQILTNAR
jgi:hypothetical protein